MSTQWLRQTLARGSDAVTDGGEPVLTITHNAGTVRVYCPEPEEYAVNVDVVEKAAELGADMIAYATTWCRVTHEGKAHGDLRGVNVVPFAGLFAFLRRNGIAFRD